jgi:eukaryotic-like serine/threonine-protein kinase
MGHVYDAWDAEANEAVAVKVLRSRAMSKENLRRFAREIESASSVRHECLCEVRAVLIEKGFPFLVMERLDGISLRARLQEDGELGVADAISVTLQLLDALAAVHEAKVLHRDVKPANVMLVGRGGSTPRVKLIDFGLSRPLFHQPEMTAITRVGTTPGTPAYLSPEQILGARNIDARVDVWGAGLTFFEALTATHPFATDEMDALAIQLTTAPLPRLALFRDDVPVEVEDVLRRSLEKRPDDRFRSARAFHDALTEAWATNRVRGIQRGKMLVEKAIPPAVEDDATRVVRRPRTPS